MFVRDFHANLVRMSSTTGYCRGENLSAPDSHGRTLSMVALFLRKRGFFLEYFENMINKMCLIYIMARRDTHVENQSHQGNRNT